MGVLCYGLEVVLLRSACWEMGKISLSLSLSVCVSVCLCVCAYTVDREQV